MHTQALVVSSLPPVPLKFSQSLLSTLNLVESLIHTWLNWGRKSAQNTLLNCLSNTSFNTSSTNATASPVKRPSMDCFAIFNPQTSEALEDACDKLQSCECEAQ